MLIFFYNVALLTVLVLGAPWWLWKMATTHKYREGMLERLGLVRAEVRRRGLAVEARPNGSFENERSIVWVHAVSVGEVLAVTRLVRELEAELPGYLIVVSTTTRTGQTLARERFGADRVFYCPLDLPWAVRAYLNALQPRMLVLAETEFWPNLLTGCFRRGIPVGVVNARISDRSWPRYRRLRGLWKPFLSRLNRVLAQSETDAERLRAIGCAANAVSVAGNLKFDVRASGEAEATRQLKALAKGLRFIVAGSTLEGEEEALLEAWPQLLTADPDLVMVLAPRHPERFAAVVALLEKSAFGWVRRSEWPARPKTSLEALIPGQIVLLDTIGELASVYSLAAVAFVGGSLIPAGGHNPLEPARYGIPIVMGHHYVNFRSITDDLLAHEALRIADRKELARVLIELLLHPDVAGAMGDRARTLFDQQAGATRRCVEALRALLFTSRQDVGTNGPVDLAGKEQG